MNKVFKSTVYKPIKISIYNVNTVSLNFGFVANCESNFGGNFPSVYDCIDNYVGASQSTSVNGFSCPIPKSFSASSICLTCQTK